MHGPMYQKQHQNSSISLAYVVMPIVTHSHMYIIAFSYVANIKRRRTESIPAANMPLDIIKTSLCENLPSINHCSISAEIQIPDNYALTFNGKYLTDCFRLINNS